MQGLVNYGASPTPSPPPSPKRGEQVYQPPTKPHAEASSSAIRLPRKGPTGIRKVPKPSPIQMPPHPVTTAAPTPPPIKSSSKRRRTSQSPSRPAPNPSAPDLPQNLTHTAQTDLPSSVLASEPTTLAEEAGETEGWPGYPGMTDDEVFRSVSRPRDTPGLDDWGIPAEVDPEECSEELKAKVANFLKLKFERGEHINTRLLSSAAFANPYIYSKLVDFVQIDEHASQFPSGGWLTRRNIEAEIPVYGPAALGVQQKAKQEATRKAQEVGKRKEIAFKSGGRESESTLGDMRSRSSAGNWDKDRNGGRSGDDRSRPRESDRNGGRERYRG